MYGQRDDLAMGVPSFFVSLFALDDTWVRYGPACVCSVSCPCQIRMGSGVGGVGSLMGVGYVLNASPLRYLPRGLFVKLGAPVDGMKKATLIYQGRQGDVDHGNRRRDNGTPAHP